MSARSWTLLSICLLLAQAFMGVAASKEVKTTMGNNTIERTVQLRTHSIFPPYIDQDLQNRWWDFGADAYVNTNKHIRLTQNKPSQMGWLWSRLALTATNYVIEVEFKVSGESSHLYGDGLAMWITTNRAMPGPVFGNRDYFEGLGIILDTYANERHSYGFPRILGVVLDGKTKYDYGNDGDAQALGACSINFRRTNVATKLKLTYVKGSILDLKVQYKAWDEWTPCFTIQGVTLPSNPFVGFSAATGDVSDAHDIISVTSYSAILSPPEAPKNNLRKTAGSWRLSKSDHYSTANGGFFSSFFSIVFKLGLFAGLCAGLWYGYQEYLRRQRYGGLGLGGIGSAPPTVGFNMGLTGPSAPSSPYGLGSAPFSSGLGSGLNTGMGSTFGSRLPSPGPMSAPAFGGMRTGLSSPGPMSASYANKRNL